MGNKYLRSKCEHSHQISIKLSQLYVFIYKNFSFDDYQFSGEVTRCSQEFLLNLPENMVPGIYFTSIGTVASVPSHFRNQQLTLAFLYFRMNSFVVSRTYTILTFSVYKKKTLRFFTITYVQGKNVFFLFHMLRVNENQF